MPRREIDLSHGLKIAIILQYLDMHRNTLVTSKYIRKLEPLARLHSLGIQMGFDVHYNILSFGIWDSRPQTLSQRDKFDSLS